MFYTVCYCINTQFLGKKFLHKYDFALVRKLMDFKLNLTELSGKSGPDYPDYPTRTGSRQSCPLNSDFNEEDSQNNEQIRINGPWKCCVG